jgi:hypothetical protein
LAGKLLVSRWFMAGFWLNFLGAVGTSLVLIVGVVYLVPKAGWGLLVVVGLDLLATFGWRIPLVSKHRKIIKQVKI